MLLKIRLTKEQLDDLQAFIGSDANRAIPPEGFMFAVPCGRSKALCLHGKGGVPVASIHHIGSHATWFSVTIEVREHILMPNEGMSTDFFQYARTYMVSAEVLLGILAVINRFPLEPRILQYDETAKFF